MAESSNEKYKVPLGLRPLLEALARETLRQQPADLITFSQLFFNVLQKHRSRYAAGNFSIALTNNASVDDVPNTCFGACFAFYRSCQLNGFLHKSFSNRKDLSNRKGLASEYAAMEVGYCQVMNTSFGSFRNSLNTIS